MEERSGDVSGRNRRLNQGERRGYTCEATIARDHDRYGLTVSFSRVIWVSWKRGSFTLLLIRLTQEYSISSIPRPPKQGVTGSTVLRLANEEPRRHGIS